MKFAISQGTEGTVGRDAIILGYYVFFVKFVGNRNKQWFTIIIWIEAGKSLTHSSCHWENDFCRKWWSFIVVVTPTQLPYRENLPYLVLFPYQEMAMTHAAYFHFHLISKSFLFFLLIWSVWSSKCTREKLIVPTILNFQKT